MLPLPCMLVCSFVCANRTRDRGCSKHPVFPAPSKQEGGVTSKPRAKGVARMRSRIQIVARMSEAISGAGLEWSPDVAALIRATAPAHAMTAERAFAFSRRNSPEVCIFFRPSRNRGRREDRVLAAPAVSRAICANKKGTRAYRAAGAIRPSLRNGFTAYFVLSPENGSFASVAREKFYLSRT